MVNKTLIIGDQIRLVNPKFGNVVSMINFSLVKLVEQLFRVIVRFYRYDPIGNWPLLFAQLDESLILKKIIYLTKICVLR